MCSQKATQKFVRQRLSILGITSVVPLETDLEQEAEWKHFQDHRRLDGEGSLVALLVHPQQLKTRTDFVQRHPE